MLHPLTPARSSWRYARRLPMRLKCARIADKYRDFTMIPREIYLANLLIAASQSQVPGCVVECGVWRGGMIAGIAEMLGPQRKYYLFDSFEGLPDAGELDGAGAKEWQQNKSGPAYFDNCRAEQRFAETAMQMSGAPSFHCVRGWFNETLPRSAPAEKIAVLRLDGDWYESTIVCLRALAPLLAPGGVIILDDYYSWDGCSRAVHQYLTETQSVARIENPFHKVCVLRGGTPGPV